MNHLTPAVSLVLLLATTVNDLDCDCNDSPRENRIENRQERREEIRDNLTPNMD